jgi:DNA ligase 1
MKLIDLVRTSAHVAATSGRLEKISRLASLLQQLEPDEIQIAIGFLIGWPRQGRIGIGWRTTAGAREVAAAAEPTLELRDVDRLLSELQATRGKSSAAKRNQLLADVFARATTEEQDFLSALAIGEVRQGALEGVMLEAVARAANVPSDRVRRAAMLAGDLGVVAQAALTEGEAGLQQYGLQLFRPVQPMLADSAADVDAALGALGSAVMEWKLDGARIQVHRQGDRVAVYTRNLNDVSAAVPEIGETVRTT